LSLIGQRSSIVLMTLIALSSHRPMAGSSQSLDVPSDSCSR
jgi:hypothetical protein